MQSRFHFPAATLPFGLQSAAIAAIMRMWLVAKNDMLSQ